MSRYFKKYSDDPASTADKLFGRHCREVGIEQFRNRTLQKERMNSGWRYQWDLKRVDTQPAQIAVPDGLLESFGKCCSQAGLVDEQGFFNDPRRMIQFFCR